MQKDSAEVAKIFAVFQFQARGPECTHSFSLNDRIIPNLGGQRKTPATFLNAFLRAAVYYAFPITSPPKGLLE